MRFKYILSTLVSFEMIVVLFIFSGRIKALGAGAIFGVDLTLMFAVLVALIFAWSYFNGKLKIASPSKPVNVFAAFLLAYLIASISWSPVSEYGLRKMYFLGTLVPLAYMAGLMCGSDAKRLYRLLTALVLFCVLYLIAAITVAGGWSALLQSDLITTVNFRSEDSISLYQQNSNLTALAATASLLIAYLLGSEFKARYVFIALAVLLALLSINLGGRAGILRLLVAFFVFVTLVGNRPLVRAFCLTTAFVVTLLLVLQNTPYLLDLADKDYLPDGISRLIYTIAQNLYGGGEARVGLGIAAYNVWVDSPALGSGLGGYPIAAGLGDVAAYPHNLFLELLSETGLIGLAMFLSFFFLHVRLVLRPILRDSQSYLNIAKLVIFCVSFSVVLFSSDITGREVPFFFGLIAASIVVGRFNSERA